MSIDPTKTSSGRCPAPWCCSTAPASPGPRASVVTGWRGTRARSERPSWRAWPGDLAPGLVEALGDSIEEVAVRHRHCCDIANPSSPQATVAALKFESGRVDYLVLAHAFVAFDPVDAGPQVITDARELVVRTECTMSLRDLPEGTVAYERARLAAVDSLRARRNQPGGYWIAKDDPQAAMEALTGSVPFADLRGAALLSNGASRIVDPYRLAQWDQVIDVLRTVKSRGVV